jgi:HJR/Mrr/RecB family endonuclease
MPTPPYAPPARPGPSWPGVLTMCAAALSLLAALVWAYSHPTSRTILWVLSPVLCLSILMLLVPWLREMYQTSVEAKEAARKKAIHDAWLQTPEGIAFQHQEHDRLRIQLQDEERQRKEAEEAAARAKWEAYFEAKTMDEVSGMKGTEFEEFLARLFSRMGYIDVKLTPTNDQGADLVCQSPRGQRIAVQGKRWNSAVGNDSVQEVLGAMKYYSCAVGMVVTNSTFTRAARELAKKAGIELCDGRWLEEHIKKYLPPEIPEFDWGEYDRIVKNYQPVRDGRAKGSKARRYWRQR